MGESNAKVARLLGELARLTELDEGDPNAFRVRAYRNAQRAVEGLDADVAGMTAADLAKVRGIGKSIAGRIREYVDTSTIERLEELRRAHPASVAALRDVPGLGPKSIRVLVEQLGIADLDGLVEALDDGRVAALDGFGQRTVDKLRAGIDELGLTSKQRRVPLADALDVAGRIVAAFERAGARRVTPAGSTRRFVETVGDLDVLVDVDDDLDIEAVLGAAVDINRVIGSGSTKVSVAADGLQIDVRRVPAGSFGAALIYFTGSRDHNIRLRQRALDRGLTLNEYGFRPHANHDHAESQGLFDEAAMTEEGVYRQLEMAWVPPEIREDDGEIEAAADGSLPRLIESEDIQGDLHVHTDVSGDGRDSLEVMVDAAVLAGLSYLATTDHAEGLAINGATRRQMLDQRRQLHDLEQSRGDIRLLHGAELNIGADGGLDYDAKFLRGFDWLVASVHSHFDLDVADQSRRVIAAMRHPSITAIGHLTGRMIGRRPSIKLDIDAILDAAVETNTAIEINASLRRLEPPREVLRQAARRGVPLVLSTDAHSKGELSRRQHGIAHARGAWITSDHVLNTRSSDEFERWLGDRIG
ncbi:MAG: DNA polymerase/3'-5' exonuclease PolX [Nitriliruptoraceae bacterium]